MSSVLSNSAPRVIVLGGSGFVGCALAKAWPSRAGRATFLVHRSCPGWMRDVDIDLQLVDLDDPAALSGATKGHDVLINLLRPDGKGWYPRLLRRLVPTFQQVKIRRCVHASSIDVYSGSAAAFINEETPIQPLSAYEEEHCEAERTLAAAFAETAILRLGAVFGPGGRNIVRFAEKMRGTPFPALALQRALYGARRMHLVSVQLVAEALVCFALNVEFNGQIVVLLTQDSDPDNNFGFIQDSLAASFHRFSPGVVPTLPLSALRLVLRLRGLPHQAVDRRFSNSKAKDLGLRTDGFGDTFCRYADYLAAQMKDCCP